MPTLHWRGREAVLDHHLLLPSRPLVDLPELALPGDPLHTLIEGDNLAALAALLPALRGRVRCICTDPPYNTGGDGWVYHDAAGSPDQRAWLDQVVGRSDLDRHDRWLCLMWPRLALMAALLAPDGVICVHIDDHELAHLLAVMDELFGEDRRIAVFTWVRKRKGSNLSREVRRMTEYVVVYKGSDQPAELHGIPAYSDKAVPLLNRANRVTALNFPAGALWAGSGLADGILARGVYGDGDLAVTVAGDVELRDGRNATPVLLHGRWRWAQGTVDDELSHGSRFTLSRTLRINVLRHGQATRSKAPSTLLSGEDGIGTNEDASAELAAMLGGDAPPFDFPKPLSLVEYLVGAVVRGDPAAIILDPFAGSGTTGHAVMRLNAADDGRRRCILAQLGRDQPDGPHIAREITRARLARVVQGYSAADGTTVPGLAQGWNYQRLG